MQLNFWKWQKHFFSVDRIVFVLAVNRSELAHSIRALYGAGFDAQGYLHRFFDIDFRLPQPDRRAFIADLIRSANIGQECGAGVQGVQNLLESFFGTPDLSLRKIAQSMHHLGLVSASLGSQRVPSLFVTALALILRTFVSDWYYRFCSGEISDMKLLEELFKHPGIRGRSDRAKTSG